MLMGRMRMLAEFAYGESVVHARFKWIQGDAFNVHVHKSNLDPILLEKALANAL